MLSPDAPNVDGQLFDAARSGDVDRLNALLDQHPEKLQIRTTPSEATLLHLAAPHLAAVDLLLKRGLDVNARDGGDNTYPTHCYRR